MLNYIYMPELNSQQQFDDIIKNYLDKQQIVSSDGKPELEIKFGTKGVKSISLIDFNNVIKKLKSSNFIQESDIYSLKIASQFRDKESGKTKESNVRTEINGFA